MEHSERKADGCTVVYVGESPSRQNFLDLLELSRSLISKGEVRLLLDLSKLRSIASEGIGLLVMVHDECEGSGGEMALCSAPRQIERVLKLAGVHTFFKFHPDEESGVEAISAAAAADAKAPKPAEKEPAPPPVPERPEELAERAREIVRTLIRSRKHQDVLEFFANRSLKVASIEEIAAALKIPRLATEHLLADLTRGEVLFKDESLYTWQPTPEAEGNIAVFRRALGSPRLRSRLLAWLYAEEKK